MKRFAIICLMCFAVGFGLSAQVAPDSRENSGGQEASAGPWTLTDCIDHALKHNLTVRQSEISVQQSEVELSTQKLRMLPSLSASASENFSFGRGLTSDNTYANANTTSTSFSLGGDIPIFSGLDITHGIKTGKLQLQSAVENLAKAKEDISVAVAQAYVEILYNKELLKVAEVQTENDTHLLEAVAAKYEAGKVSEADVSAQKAALAQSQLSETQSRNNYNLSLLTLSQLLELPSPDGFEIVEPDVDNAALGLLMKPEDIYADAVSVKPAVLSAQTMLDYAEVNVKGAKGAYLPTLSLSGGIGTNFYTSSNLPRASFSQQLRNNFSQYVGLSLNIPIFSRMSTRNQVRTAKLNQKNQEIQLEIVKKELYKEIQQAYYNAVASQAKYVSSLESARSAERHFILTEEKYRNGKASVTDYNDAKSAYLRAASEHLQSKYESVFQTKLLDFYRGLPLDF